MWNAFSLVTGSFTLLAFIASVGVGIWTHNIRKERSRIKRAGPEDQVRLAEIAADYIKFDLSHIPRAQRAEVVMHQMKLKADFRKSVLVAASIIAIVFLGVTAWAIGLNTSPAIASIPEQKTPPATTPSKTEPKPEAPIAQPANTAKKSPDVINPDDPHRNVNSYIDETTTMKAVR